MKTTSAKLAFCQALMKAKYEGKRIKLYKEAGSKLWIVKEI